MKDSSKMIEEYNRLYREICRALFDQHIKPLADRHDWEIDWAMGSVSFVNKSGKELMGGKVLRDMSSICTKAFSDMGFRQNNGLWDVMSSISCSGCYHKSYGFANYDERIRS